MLSYEHETKSKLSIPIPGYDKQTYIKPTIKNPNIIVGGNPARVIRKRFDDEFIELLEKFKWWDKSIDKINELIPMLTNSNLSKVKEFLKKNNK